MGAYAGQTTMTEQERQLIESLAVRLRNLPTPEVNPEAEDLIRRTIGSHPHALYILTQTVLLQEIALKQAKAKATPAPSFLGDAAPAGNRGRDGRLNTGSGFGGAYRGSSYQTGVPPTPPPVPPQTWGQAQPQQAGWVVSGQPQSRMSSFLQGAAETAAGVVAGEMAFSALSSIFGHHGGGFLGGGGGWGGGGWGGGGGMNETIINNNYYQEEPHHQHHQEAGDHISQPESDASDSDDSGASGGYDDGADTLDI